MLDLQIRTWAVVGVILATAGCTVVNSTPCEPAKLKKSLASTALKTSVYAMAEELCGANNSSTGQEYAVGVSSPVLVTDFANLESYAPEQAGLLISELMRSAVSVMCGKRIIQAEFGKYFKLSPQGLVVLTRDPNEIQKDEFSTRDIIVGTYSLQGGKLTLFARSVDAKTSLVNKMVAREVTYICDRQGQVYTNQ